jgi:hypothetical protein
MDQREFELRAAAAAHDHAAWVRRDLAQMSADRYAAVRGEPDGTRPAEPAGEHGEHRQVSMQTNPAHSPHAER